MKFKNNTVLVQSLLSIALMGAINVQAQTTEKVVVPGKVVQVGKAESNVEPLKGFAKDLPLKEVLKQLTPSGWILKKNESKDDPIDLSKPASWSGGKPWFETLDDVAKENNLQVVVAWDTKNISVSKSRTIEIPKAPVVATANSGMPPALNNQVAANNRPHDPQRVPPHLRVNPPAQQVASSGNPAAAPQAVFNVPNNPASNATAVFELEAKGISSTPVQHVPRVIGGAPVVQPQVVARPVEPVAPPVKSWTKVSGKTLKENVKLWADKAGYRLVWNGEDYPVDDSAPLFGEFDGDNGPIKQLSIDYGPDSRVNQPLSFEFFGNRTLVVENHAFEQSGFPQYSKKDSR